MGGLDIPYLPQINVRQLVNCQPEPSCTTTGETLRGLFGTRPHFHDGSAQTLLDLARFYEKRFGRLRTNWTW
jgi:cytochrome c peroxidase